MTRHQAIYILTKRHKLDVNTTAATSKWLITAAEWYEARNRRRTLTRTGATR